MSLSDDSEDSQLKLAIALSLQDDVDHERNHAKQKSTEPKSENATIGIFSSLDRKKMEQERLARLAGKRNREVSDMHDENDMPMAKKKGGLSADLSSYHGDVPFPEGVVKRTWVRGYDRTNDDIKIEEIFQKKDLVLAFLSSFQWDEPWLLSKIDVSRTKVVLAAFAQDESQKEAMQRNVPKNIRFCFPKMQGFGSMHSKLQILKFAKYVRIVVPTGNLVPHDWGETGFLENMIFIIDLPLKISRDENTVDSAFLIQIQSFLRAMGVEESMVSSLAKYNFSKADKMRFIYSIPGSHSGASFFEIGYNALGRAVTSLGMDTQGPLQIDLACASLGAVKMDLVEAMYRACQDLQTNLLLSYGLDLGHGRGRDHESTNDDPGPSSLNPTKLSLNERFRIYFPSHNTVKNSRGGQNAAGTICLQKKWWLAATFPRHLVCDCVNTRQGLLMHSKIILVRPDEAAVKRAERGQSWAYVGSANLSESAWGRVFKDRRTAQSKILCRNWECGVVLPVHLGMASQSASVGVIPGIIPVPMQIPGRKYSQDEQPWFFQTP